MERGRWRRSLLGLLTMYGGRFRPSQTTPWHRPSRLALRASSLRADNLEERQLLHGSHLHLTSASEELLLPGAGTSSAHGHQNIRVPVGVLVDRGKLNGALLVLQLHPHQFRLPHCRKEIEEVLIVEPDAQRGTRVRDIYNFLCLSVLAAGREYFEPSLLKLKLHSL